MANIPIKWGKVGTDGKAEVNGADNTTFSSSSPAFKVNGDEEITGDSSVGGGQSITGNSSVGGNQSVTGNETVGGNETINGDLIVNKDNTTNKVGINVASPTEVLDVSGNIKASGNLMSSGGDLSLGTSGSDSDDSGDIVWKYGNGQEKARLWTDNTYTASKGINYRTYKSDGTNLFSGTLALGDDSGFAKVANTCYGIYTGSGGQQGPAYFGRSRAGFLMSNVTVAGDSHYKNWIYMDNYGGDDVGGATAIGVDRMEPRAFIMRSDANRTSWNNTAALGVFTATPTSGKVVVTDGTTGGIKSSGYGISEGNTGSTIVARNANGYIYGTYFNASCGNDNGATSSSYALYSNSDNWLRKCSMSKLHSALGGSGCVQLYSGNLAKGVETSFNYGSYSAYVVIFRIDGNDSFFVGGVMPKGKLASSSPGYMYSYDGYNWAGIHMRYSGSLAYIKCDGSNANVQVRWVYGLY